MITVSALITDCIEQLRTRFQENRKIENFMEARQKGLTDCVYEIAHT